MYGNKSAHHLTAAAVEFTQQIAFSLAKLLCFQKKKEGGGVGGGEENEYTEGKKKITLRSVFVL